MTPALFQTLRNILEQPASSTRLTVHGLEQHIRVAAESGWVTTAHYGALNGLGALRAMYELPETLFEAPHLQTKLWTINAQISFEDMIKSRFDHTLDKPSPDAMAVLAAAPHLTLGYAVKNGTPLKFTHPVNTEELTRAFTLAGLPLLKQFRQRPNGQPTAHQRTRLSAGILLFPLPNDWVAIAHVQSDAGKSVAETLERELAQFAPSEDSTRDAGTLRAA